MLKEQELFIPTTDNFVIKSTLSGQNSETLYIIAHGLTNESESMVPSNLRDALIEAGHDVLLFLFYGHPLKTGQNMRRMEHCSLNDHADDTLSILQWASQQGYKRIVLVNHSIAAVAFLLAAQKDQTLINTTLDHVVSIDPAYDVKPFWEIFDCIHDTANPEIKEMRLNQSFLISKTLVDDINAHNGATCLKLAQEQKISVSGTIIMPEESLSLLSKPEHRLNEFADAQNWGLVTMPNANHKMSKPFNTRDLAKIILEKTI